MNDNDSRETLPQVQAPSAETGKKAFEVPVNNLSMKESVAAKFVEQPAAGGGHPAQPTQTPTQNPFKQPPQTLTTSGSSHPVTQKSSPSAPGMADDNDLIEKEWVQKAKAIIERTKNDPHQQNQEITSYKADYIKKRFNKDTKVSEA